MPVPNSTSSGMGRVPVSEPNAKMLYIECVLAGDGEKKLLYVVPGCLYNES